MMTQALALAAPDVFTAVAPCSGVFFRFIMGEGLLDQTEIQNRPDVVVPIWMFGGEQEPWLLPHLPKDGNDTAYSINLWRKYNHLGNDAITDFENGWKIYADRWHEISFTDEKNIPLVKYTWVDYMPHATMTEMSYRIWDEFFSHFARVEQEIIFTL